MAIKTETMTWTDEKNYDGALLYINWSRDEIIRLEEENEKLQKQIEQLGDHAADLMDTIKDLRSQLEAS